MKTHDDFLNIAIHEKPLIDCRAPIEYSKGSFINAVNLPLMNDEERHLVGICYKEKGNDEAVKLGHQLISGAIKEERIKAWEDFLSNHPDTMIFCFRGGLRSRICQQWIAETTGNHVPRLEGGYKAFRNVLIQAMSPSNIISTPVILGGYTGSGKTMIIEKLDHAINLEALSNHRGSSFGKYITPQPSQINFENNLAYALLQHKHKDYSHMILEDEGRNIGKCYLPKDLSEYFNTGHLVILDVPLETRIHRTIKEYVIEAQNLFNTIYGLNNGIEKWYSSILHSLDNISKRLGSERVQRVKHAFASAFKHQQNNTSFTLHYDWIKILLQEYYDPMYAYQLKNTTKTVIFRGNTQEVYEYLTTKVFGIY
ncbi:MAG: tRNA 2-selenouridine(34) synthase MnmH [Eubacteriales bacterium]